MDLILSKNSEWCKDVCLLVRKIEKHFKRTRFSIGTISVKEDNPRIIKLFGIRLKAQKPYCGNHPGPCLIGNTEKHSKYLEGLDWVDFNDRLNDLLDRLKIDATVRSTTCVIRMGTRRRVRYSMRYLNWNKKGDEFFDYRDYTGQVAHSSTYPEGTPGKYTRTRGANL